MTEQASQYQADGAPNAFRIDTTDLLGQLADSQVRQIQTLNPIAIYGVKGRREAFVVGNNSRNGGGEEVPTATPHSLRLRLFTHPHT